MLSDAGDAHGAESDALAYGKPNCLPLHKPHGKPHGKPQQGANRGLSVAAASPEHEAWRKLANEISAIG